MHTHIHFFSEWTLFMQLQYLGVNVYSIYFFSYPSILKTMLFTFLWDSCLGTHMIYHFPLHIVLLVHISFGIEMVLYHYSTRNIFSTAWHTKKIWNFMTDLTNEHTNAQKYIVSACFPIIMD